MTSLQRQDLNIGLVTLHVETECGVISSALNIDGASGPDWHPVVSQSAVPVLGPLQVSPMREYDVEPTLSPFMEEVMEGKVGKKFFQAVIPCYLNEDGVGRLGSSEPNILNRPRTSPLLEAAGLIQDVDGGGVPNQPTQMIWQLPTGNPSLHTTIAAQGYKGSVSRRRIMGMVAESLEFEFIAGQPPKLTGNMRGLFEQELEEGFPPGIPNGGASLYPSQHACSVIGAQISNDFMDADSFELRQCVTTLTNEIEDIDIVQAVNGVKFFQIKKRTILAVFQAYKTFNAGIKTAITDAYDNGTRVNIDVAAYAGGTDNNVGLRMRGQITDYNETEQNGLCLMNFTLEVKHQRDGTTSDGEAFMVVYGNGF